MQARNPVTRPSTPLHPAASQSPISRVLPRIIGVEHVPENLPAVKRMIDQLPPNSRIGLEMSGLMALTKLPPRLRRYVQFNTPGHGFFASLAKYAKDNGHKVYWLETPASFHAGHARLNAEMEAAFKLKTKSQRLARLARLDYKSAVQAIRLAEWRSGIMARRLLRYEWKPTDVAFTGRRHAEHLREMLGAKVEQQPAHYEEALGHVAKVLDAAFSQPFEKLRRAAKAVRRLRKRFASRRTPSTPRASPR